MDLEQILLVKYICQYPFVVVTAFSALSRGFEYDNF